jgi:ParB/RepB/Spo0J family partition protein
MEETTARLGVQSVPCELLDVDEAHGNDRTVFDAGELELLAASIREIGQLTPVLVRPHPEVVGRFVIVAGERRTRAIRDVIGAATIVVDVRDLTADEAWSAMLDENLRRTDLDPIDEARGMRERMEHYGWSIAETARRCGRSPGTVADRLLLLALCDEVADLVRTGQLPIGRAILLAPLAAAGQRAAVREADLPAEAFRRLVGKLTADQDQMSMNLGPLSLEQQVWDTAAGEYAAEARDEIAAAAGGPELVGPGEIAERLGVKRNTIAQWRRRHRSFPVPLAFLADGRTAGPRGEGQGLPVWAWADIRAWAAEVRTA